MSETLPTLYTKKDSQPAGETGFKIGMSVDGYEITGILGQGGMGAVYMAKHLMLNRDVAIKVLAQQHMKNHELVDRFLREARSLAEVSHPGIIAVHDLRLQGDYPWIVMEFVEGVSLEAMLEEKKKLSVKDTVQIAAQIAEALDHAHNHGIIHRDLKPPNILINKDGVVKVADFGLAGILGEPKDQRLTAVDVVMGTPGFMAPEIRSNPMDVDGRADLYSLGVNLYQMLTGKIPSGYFQPPDKLNPEVPPELSQLVLSLLAQEPENRPQTAREVASRLAPWMTERGASEFRSMVQDVKVVARPRLAALDDIWAHRSFVTALLGLVIVCIVSFNILDLGPVARATRSLVPLSAVAAIIMGWLSIGRIRRSQGAAKGARFATFGMIMGLWLFFIIFISHKYDRSPSILFLSRFPMVIAAVCAFALWDWLHRTQQELGTLFTQSGGRYERAAWFVVLLAPAFLLIPFLQYVEPEYLLNVLLFRWIAIGIGPVIYILLVVLPGARLK